MKILFSDRFNKDNRLGKKLSNFSVKFNDFENEDLELYDLLIPMTHKDIMYLMDLPLNKNINYLIPPEEIYLICQDKLLFYQKCIEGGFGMYFPKHNIDTKYPFVLKRRRGAFGNGCFIISNRIQEAEIKNKINNLDNYFKQECIEGDKEYSSHIIFFQGKIRFFKTVCHSFNLNFASKFLRK